MNKKILSLTTTLLLVLSFASCGKRNTPTTDRGVVIEGIRWATRNIDAPGTFTKNSEDVGGFFNWEEAQNACPQGWRVPTRDEFQSLIDAGYEWTTQNDVFGGLFGSGRNQVFLPAAGNDRVPDLAGYLGMYWSSTSDEMNLRRRLAFDSFEVNVFLDRYSLGSSVRCVAK